MAKKTLAQAQAETQTPEIQFYSPADELVGVSLASLVPLEATSVSNAVYAQREINKQHVDHLLAAIEAGEQLPAIKLVRTSEGNITIDGYHRWAAYEKHLALVLEESATDDTPISAEQHATMRQQYIVLAEEVEVNSARHLLQLAFEANLKHGLPASDNSRTRYALWLLSEAKQAGEKMSVREAGRIAHVSHVAILKAAKKLAGATTKKMVDVQLTDEDQEEAATIDTDKEEKIVNPLVEADKHMQALLKAGKYFINLDWSAAELDVFIGQYGKSVTKENVVNAVKILNILYGHAQNTPEPEQQELAMSDK